MAYYKQVQKGAVDVTVYFKALDATTGLPVTAFAFNQAGIDMWYRRDGTNDRVAITEATLASIDAAHSDGGIIFIDDGVCRLDLPDAAVSTVGGSAGVVYGGSATDIICEGGYVQLTGYPPGSDFATVQQIYDKPSSEVTVAGSMGVAIKDILTDTGTTLDAKLDAIDNFIDTEIASIISSLSTLDGKIDTIDNLLDTEIASIITSLSSMDTKIDTIDNFLDTEIATLLTKGAYRKNVAVTGFMIYMELTGGGPATGIANVTLQISKDGTAFANAAANGGVATEVSSGWYKIDVAQGEMNADEIAHIVTGTGCKTRNYKFRTTV